MGLPLASSPSHPSVGERKPWISMTPYFTTTLMKINTSSNHLERVLIIYHILCLVLLLISFYERKRLINRNFFKIYVSGKMLMTLPTNLFLISFMITGIPSVNEESCEQCLTLNSILAQVIPHLFVVVN